MRDLSEIKVRPPRSVAEAARWVGLTLACIVIAYFVVALVFALTGVWGGE
jgi:predicted anti-sigma-YlaC factor YlaD